MKQLLERLEEMRGDDSYKATMEYLKSARGKKKMAVFTDAVEKAVAKKIKGDPWTMSVYQAMGDYIGS